MQKYVSFFEKLNGNVCEKGCFMFWSQHTVSQHNNRKDIVLSTCVVLSVFSDLVRSSTFDNAFQNRYKDRYKNDPYECFLICHFYG